MRKKCFFTLFCILLFTVVCGVSVSAKTSMSKVISHMTVTDTRVFIDRMEVPVYAIDGHIVVSENDLPKYGFSTHWDNNTKTITFTRQTPPISYPEFKRINAKAGTKIANVYSSNIRAFIDKSEVRAYYIGGKTMIALDDFSNQSDMAKFSLHCNDAIGYSYQGVKFDWDKKKKELHIYFLRICNTVHTKYGTFHIIGYTTACEVDSKYNKDLPISSVGPSFYDKYNLFFDNSELKKHYVNINGIFDYLSIPYKWQGGDLFFTLPSENKNVNLTFDPSYSSNLSTNAILPIVRVFIYINNNKKEENYIDAVVYNGELYMNMDDFRDYILG